MFDNSNDFFCSFNRSTHHVVYWRHTQLQRIRDYIYYCYILRCITWEHTARRRLYHLFIVLSREHDHIKGGAGVFPLNHYGKKCSDSDVCSYRCILNAPLLQQYWFSSVLDSIFKIVFFMSVFHRLHMQSKWYLYKPIKIWKTFVNMCLDLILIRLGCLLTII